ncbi:MAG TPA: hypothetical protein DCM02_02830 [Flavobacterium sp.]|nr:hypothetical protein [Flavobacterium sp.]HAT76908.1 hypothetical protein [Flavobacterium sp.]HAT80913.1 hypothetical protein [Flavobacterium sp.]
MKDISNTNQRIAFALEQMKKALPSVKVQVAVYERNLQLGKTQKKPTSRTTIQECLSLFYLS